MKKLLKFSPQAALFDVASQRVERYPFCNVAAKDIAVEVTEFGCGEQYRVGTVMLCSQLGCSSLMKEESHYLFELSSGLAIIREFSAKNVDKISLVGVLDRALLQLNVEDISKIHKIKSLYYRSDM